MERIIYDNYQKNGKHLFEFDDNPNDEFNLRITAANNMYGWLYENGILEKISFEFKDYSDITYFAFDAKDLLPYRKDMEASGVEDADLATNHIFDVEYSPCHYSGAIQIGWTMLSYRDFEGTVSRDWECGLSRHLSSEAVLYAQDIKEKQGVKAAVKAMFELSGFEKTDMISVRALTEQDAPQVGVLDEMSGNKLCDGLDSEDYVWGVFYGDKLAGYCSLGGAEDYEGFRGWNDDALVLCDVYVSEKHRGKGMASEMIEAVISENTAHGEKIFVTILDENLAEFYEKFGFKRIDEDSGVMLRTGKAREKDSLAKKILSATLKKAKETLDKDGKDIEAERN